VNGRKAFFSGELRAWGNPLLAPKFGSVFKVRRLRVAKAAVMLIPNVERV
jgi:hypothetical protein